MLLASAEREFGKKAASSKDPKVDYKII